MKEDEVESVQDASHGLAPLVEQQEAHHQHGAAVKEEKGEKEKRSSSRTLTLGDLPKSTWIGVNDVARFKHVLTVHRREILGISQPQTRVLVFRDKSSSMCDSIRD